MKPQLIPEYLAPDHTLDMCPVCDAPMTPWEALPYGDLYVGEVNADGNVWIRCTGCGGPCGLARAHPVRH